MLNTSGQPHCGIYATGEMPHAEQGDYQHVSRPRIPSTDALWACMQGEMIDNKPATSLPRLGFTRTYQHGDRIDQGETEPSSGLVFPLDSGDQTGDAFALNLKTSSGRALFKPPLAREQSPATDYNGTNDPMSYILGLTNHVEMLMNSDANRNLGSRHDQSDLFSTPARHEESRPALYAPVCLSNTRPSVLEWTDTLSYCDPSQNEVSKPIAGKWPGQQEPHYINQHTSFKNYGSNSMPLTCAPHEEFRLETGSLPDLSSSRRPTPSSRGAFDGITLNQPWSPQKPYSKVHSDVHGMSAESFSPRSFNQAAPLPTFEKSHPEIHLHDRPVFASSHGAISDTTPELLDSSVPTPLKNTATPMSGIISCISIPSAPHLFSNIPIQKRHTVDQSAYSVSRAHGFVSSAPYPDPRLSKSEGGRIQSLKNSLSSASSISDLSKSKTDKPKRKRTHICHICGKDFNRPSALLLHSSVHTGERSNFCNVCGRSFSNLSNLRRHQRQLHVLESEIPLPEIPGPQATFSPYTLADQELFGF
ncbi:uncharacterized protein MELLADRAFT_115486 [Melampsora larici-populina 98AG31]|uniref:C2H2-type domain-containing protein n=1 Tax=Melampsora larici-populina (strain 98AG31 / pathotype 3-4-7) TaxID=747676 RepID=F4R9V2_MELLP|nr:uncharacterized protein MELLADRAFT_115486 [Melampsora larici-populina 98AG31]EGG10590.1 hypothetical protein MELLADRAFT_115486 [Melampsora larici-populina 98AG31]